MNSFQDIVKYFEIRTKRKAQLQPLGVIAPLKWSLSDSIDYCTDIVSHCFSIGISPRDDVLKVDYHQTINMNIVKIFKKHHVLIYAVGEWSDKHRWHYHGLVECIDMSLMDKIKRLVNRQIGRCVTETIKYDKSYVEYMHKAYTTEDISNRQPWRNDSFLSYKPSVAPKT